MVREQLGKPSFRGTGWQAKPYGGDRDYPRGGFHAAGSVRRYGFAPTGKMVFFVHLCAIPRLCLHVLGCGVPGFGVALQVGIRTSRCCAGNTGSTPCGECRCLLMRGRSVQGFPCPFFSPVLFVRVSSLHSGAPIEPLQNVEGAGSATFQAPSFYPAFHSAGSKMFDGLRRPFPPLM